jgi:hypothetical protein
MVTWRYIVSKSWRASSFPPPSVGFLTSKAVVNAQHRYRRTFRTTSGRHALSERLATSPRLKVGKEVASPGRRVLAYRDRDRDAPECPLGDLSQPALRQVSPSLVGKRIWAAS